MPLTQAFMVEMYRRMVRIRLFEEKVGELVAAGRIPGAAHLSIGQEAVAVGACMALREDDYMTGNHRSHGHPIAKGSDLKPLMAELFGKRGGICKGKGGSMHLADFKVGSLGESGIVASAIPIAVGAGLSIQVRGTNQVCLAFFGDGAANAGAFHEALNLAAVWSLPVIFLCENNLYAITTRSTDVTAVENVAERAGAYSMPGIVVDGQDPLAVHSTTRDAVERARAGKGPSLIEAKTYRFREHTEGLILRRGPYRELSEIEEWKARDPLLIFAKYLAAESLATQEELATVRRMVQSEVDEAVECAGSMPDPRPEEAFEDMFATSIEGSELGREVARGV